MDFLTEEFIDNLPYTDEKIIKQYIKHISKNIAIKIQNGMDDSTARCEANKLYGKWWRDRLTSKMIYNNE